MANICNRQHSFKKFLSHSSTDQTWVLVTSDGIIRRKLPNFGQMSVNSFHNLNLGTFEIQGWVIIDDKQAVSAVLKEVSMPSLLLRF